MVATDLGKKVDRFTDLMNEVDGFTLGELFMMARFFELDDLEMLLIVEYQHRISKPKKDK